jgi:hypothetical protein
MQGFGNPLSPILFLPLVGRWLAISYLVFVLKMTRIFRFFILVFFILVFLFLLFSFLLFSFWSFHFGLFILVFSFWFFHLGFFILVFSFWSCYFGLFMLVFLFWSFHFGLRHANEMWSQRGGFFYLSSLSLFFIFSLSYIFLVLFSVLFNFEYVEMIKIIEIIGITRMNPLISCSQLWSHCNYVIM